MLEENEVDANRYLGTFKEKQGSQLQRRQPAVVESEDNTDFEPSREGIVTQYSGNFLLCQYSS
jgi:hypothetical protein